MITNIDGFVYEVTDCIEEGAAVIDGNLNNLGNLPKYITVDGKQYKVYKFGGNSYYYKFSWKYSGVDKSKIPELDVVQIPDHISHVEARCFERLTIKKLIIGSGLEYIPTNCFWLATINEVTFSKESRLKTIAANAFHSCIGLKSIHLPDSVKHINSCAFYGCTDLVEVSLPTLNCLSESSFKGCKNLKKVIFRDELPAGKGKNFSVIFPAFNGKRIRPTFYISEEKMLSVLSIPEKCRERSNIVFVRKNTGEPFTENLCFKIVDEVNCIVTCCLDKDGNNSYKGDIVIPDSTIIGNKLYTVIGLDDFAFYGCNLNTIELPKYIRALNPLSIEGDCVILNRK